MTDLEISLASFDYASHTQEELTAARFDEAAFYQNAPFTGTVLIQTCNRVEILAHAKKSALEDFLKKENRSGFLLFENDEVLRHLSKLAAGIESLIVGEDQILGQLKTALLAAESRGKADPVCATSLLTAIKLGSNVREKTAINRGAVSIGSAAVHLAEVIVGDLTGKNILIVGGGEIGRLVTKSLAEKNLRAIYVTNRTYENAQILAKEVNGRAMHLDQLYPCIGLSDVVISCTAAPHEIIRASPLAEIMEARQWPLDDEPRPLILIDIAQPCDVEKSCKDIAGVRLYTIDDLKEISEQNMSARRSECLRAEEIIEDFQPEFQKIIRRTAAEGALGTLYSWADEICKRETARALQMLERGKDPAEIITHLSASITKKMLDDTAAAIRRSAEENNLETTEKIIKTITRGDEK